MPNIVLMLGRTPPARSNRLCRRARVTIDTLSAKIASGTHRKSAWPRTVKECRTERRSSQPNPARPASATAKVVSARARRDWLACLPGTSSGSVARSGDSSLTAHPRRAAPPLISSVNRLGQASEFKFHEATSRLVNPQQLPTVRLRGVGIKDRPDPTLLGPVRATAAAQLPQPCQPVDVVSSAPHPPPAVACACSARPRCSGTGV